jgi:hypothetical protein
MRSGPTRDGGALGSEFTQFEVRPVRTYPEMFGGNCLKLLPLRRAAVWVACGFWIASAAACAPTPPGAPLPTVRSAAPETGAERADLPSPPVKASADEAQNPLPPAKPGAAAHDGRDATDEPFDRLREIVLTEAVRPTPPKPEPAPAVVPAVCKMAARPLPSPAATNTFAGENDSFNRLFAVTSYGPHAPSPDSPSPGSVISIGARASAPAETPSALLLLRFMDSGKIAPMPNPPPPPAATAPRTAAASPPDLKAEPAPAAPGVAAAPPAKPAPAVAAAPAPALLPQVAETEAPAPPVTVAAPPPTTSAPVRKDEPAMAAPEVVAASPTLAANPGKAGDLGGTRQDTDCLLFLVLVQTFAILAVVIIGPLAFLLALCHVLRRHGSSLGSLFNVKVVNNTAIPGLTVLPAGLAPPKPSAAKTAPVEDGEPTTARNFDFGPTFEEHQTMLEEASHRQAEALHRKVLEQNVQLTEQLEGIEEEGTDSAGNLADPHSHLWKQIGDLRGHLEEPGENRDAPPFFSYVHEEEPAEGEAEGAAENGQGPAGAPTHEAPERVVE